MSTSPPSSDQTQAAPSGNMLLWILLALALGFAVWQPRSPQATMALVDWQTIGALAGLLAITQAVERSGMLQATAQRLLTRVSTLRGLALLLTATAAIAWRRNARSR